MAGQIRKNGNFSLTFILFLNEICHAVQVMGTEMVLRHVLAGTARALVGKILVDVRVIPALMLVWF